ncbi:MAG: DUF423 domain-containing protein [Deltaproteobacteria bacterium]|nr:DUF423 domain-containing protein [Deltaproteobacteria bacterium]
MHHRSLLVLGGLTGALGVAMGAFGAHGLKSWLQAADDGAQRLAWWHTGAQYQLVHALLLVAVGMWARSHPGRLVHAAGACALLGVALFSGTLYAMALGGPRVLGAVTPLGGVSLLAAWTLLVVAAWRGDQA